MKKIKLALLAMTGALCMSAGAVAFNSNMYTANAEETQTQNVELSKTAYKVSTNKEKMLLVTAIKNYTNVYEVGYEFTGYTIAEGDIAQTKKYYDTLTTGGVTEDADDIFGSAWTDAKLIVWEVANATNVSFNAYALEGVVENGVLVKPEEEIKATSAVRNNNKYTVTFVDGNGATLSTQELYNGQMPQVPQVQVPENTAEYTYSAAWDKEIAVVTGETTYTWVVNAVKNCYDVSVVSSNTVQGQVNGTGANDLEYGTAITANANVLTIGENQITATAALGYKFVKWQATVGEETVDVNGEYTVEGDVTISAVWELVFDEYYASGQESLKANVSYSTAKVYGDEEYSTLVQGTQWAVSFKLCGEPVEGGGFVKIRIYYEKNIANLKLSTKADAYNGVIASMKVNTWNEVTFTSEQYNSYVQNGTFLYFVGDAAINKTDFYFSAPEFTKLPYASGQESLKANVSYSTAKVYGDESYSTLVQGTAWAVSFKLCGEPVEGNGSVTIRIYYETNIANLKLSTKADAYNGVICSLKVNTWNEVVLSAEQYNSYIENGTFLYFVGDAAINKTNFYFSAPEFTKLAYASGQESLKANVSISTAKVYGDEKYSTLVQGTAWAVSFKLCGEPVEGTGFVVIRIYYETNISNLKLSTKASTASGVICSLQANTWNEVALTVEQYNSYVQNGTFLYFAGDAAINKTNFYFSAPKYYESVYASGQESLKANVSISTAKVYGDEEYSTCVQGTQWAVSFKLCGKTIEGTGSVKIRIYYETNIANLKLSTQTSNYNGVICSLQANTWNEVVLTVEQYNSYVQKGTFLYFVGDAAINKTNFYFSAPEVI